MVPAQPIAEILGLGASIRSMRELDCAVAAGLPKECLVSLAACLYCDNRSASAFRFGIVPRASWNRRQQHLSPDQSGRVERLARVLASAEFVLGDRDEARSWLTAPHGELEGKSPLESARSEIGARMVESVLARMLFVKSVPDSVPARMPECWAYQLGLVQAIPATDRES